MCLNARARLLQGYKIGFQAQRGAMILSANSGGGGTGLNWVGDHNYFLRCWLLQYSARETTIGFVYVLRQKVRGATGIIVIALCTRKAIGGGRDGGPHTNRIIFTTQTIHSSTLLHNLWVILSARQAGSAILCSRLIPAKHYWLWMAAADVVAKNRNRKSHNMSFEYVSAAPKVIII